MKVDDLHSPRKRKVNNATNVADDASDKEAGATQDISAVDDWVHISVALTAVLASIPQPSSGDNSDDE